MISYEAWGRGGYKYKGSLKQKRKSIRRRGRGKSKKINNKKSRKSRKSRKH